MSVNQKRIAEALDVSVITVSRALRNHPDLAEATKARILEKARELGYKKIQVQGNEPVPKRLGVLFYEGEGSQREAPLESGIKRGIFTELQRECQRNHVEVMIEMPSLDELPLLVKNKTVTAAFLFGRYTPAAVAMLRDLPVLAVSSFIKCSGIPRIVADNLQGMKEATELLIELGHQKILFLGLIDNHTQIYRERADGYTVAMHRHGLTPELEFCEFRKAPIEKLKNYTALVCSNDSLAYFVQDDLVRAGWRLPEDLSIVAFDDLPVDQQTLITTYAPDWKLMGRLAANLLISQPSAIQGKDVVVTVPGRMAIRDSTRPLR